MKSRRETNVLSLAFLDVICCGFGAIILLLMISRFGIPPVLELTLEELIAQLAERQTAIEEILGDIERLERVKVESEQDLELQIEEIQKLQEELIELTSRFESTKQITDTQADEIEKLAQAKQSLTDEMTRLLGSDYRRLDNTIGGITVDSEYIIFVMDTSGSMRAYWSVVVAKFQEVLNIYPEVKGVQILNNDGDYIFPQFAGEWLRDTPELRRHIIERFGSWSKQSVSNPVPGISEAITTYYDPNKRISLYVFGDDFNFEGNMTVEQVVDNIDKINQADNQGNRRVRIHALGFPTYLHWGQPINYLRYGSLMRELTVRNHGTFVGLPARN